MKAAWYEPVVEVTRGGVVESVHYGAAAVADRSGRLLAWVGDPQAVTFLRSSAKPFQALPLVEGGGLDAYGLTPRQLALICASHAGTDAHKAMAESIQAKVGLEESQLLCGTHPPYDLADLEPHARLRGTADPQPAQLLRQAHRHAGAGPLPGPAARDVHRPQPSGAGTHPGGLQRDVRSDAGGGAAGDRRLLGADLCRAAGGGRDRLRAPGRSLRVADEAGARRATHRRGHDLPTPTWSTARGASIRA